MRTSRFRRRGILAGGLGALVLAAATVVAVGQAPGQPAQPTGSRDAGAVASSPADGWTWQRADATAVRSISRLAAGYVGLCGRTTEATPCTSSDGSTWTAAPDPSIYVDPIGGSSRALDILDLAGTFVAWGFMSPSVWLSADGLSWEQAPVEVDGQVPMVSTVLQAGDEVVVLEMPTDGPGRILRSSDGRTWTRSTAQLPVYADAAVGGPAGLYVTGMAKPDAPTATWRTRDGERWTPVVLPEGLVRLDAPIAVGGGFVAVGSSYDRTRRALLTSPDGTTWTVDATAPIGNVGALVSVGGRLLAGITQAQAAPETFAPSDPALLWQSLDGGTSWSRLARPGGAQASGLVEAAGGRLFVYEADLEAGLRRLAFVGAPVPQAGEGPTPSNSTLRPRITGRPSPTPTPWPSPPRASGTTAGMSWRTTAAPAYRALFAVPTGYVLVTAAEPPAVYTSPDLTTWTTPPDPAIFVNESAAPFAIDGRRPARGPAGYVIGTGSTTVWLSPDGIHWRLRHIASQGVQIDNVRPARGGYLATEAMTSDRYWSSSDGLTWKQAAFDAWRTLTADEPDELLLAGGEGDWSWWSGDGGGHWQQTPFPARGRLLYGLAKLRSTYISIWSVQGSGSGSRPNPTFVFTSPDMKHWTTLRKPPFAMPLSIAVVGRRAFVLEQTVGSNLDLGPGKLWTSVDGVAWDLVVDQTGHAVMGDNVRSVGGRLVIEGYADGSRIRYAGTPEPAPQPPLVPLPSPVVWPSDPPLPTPTPTPVPTVTGTPAVTPAQGISRSEALRIAADKARPPIDQPKPPYVVAVLDEGSGRWVWFVEFTFSWSGPLNAHGYGVQIDFASGQIIEAGGWIS